MKHRINIIRKIHCLLSLIIFGFLPSLSLAQEVTVGVGFALPPYVIQEDNSGIELDIINAIFSLKGHTSKIIYWPNARVFSAFEAGQVDVASNVKKGLLRRGYYSDTVVTFHNAAISLKKNKGFIKNINDLKHEGVLAFQNASRVLGTEFTHMASTNENYAESADQSNHVVMLYRGRVDFIISDIAIFYYHRKQALISNRLNPKEIDKPVNFNRIFSENHYVFAFLDEKIKNDFNEGLKEIRKNGLYDRILKKYKM